MAPVPAGLPSQVTSNIWPRCIYQLPIFHNWMCFRSNFLVRNDCQLLAGNFDINIYQHYQLSGIGNILAVKSHFVSIPALKTPVLVQVLCVTVPSCSSYTHNVLVSCFGIRPELAPATVPFYLSMLSQSNPRGTVFWELQAHQSCYLQ